MLDVVIKDIFVSCDVDCAGSVETSKLIEFITPFLHSDAAAVAELKKSLDPDDSNPSIDIQKFHNCMKEWTLKISGGENEDFHDITPRDFQQLEDDSFIQSTPRSSFGHHLLKGYFEAGIMNMSACSTYSLSEFTTARGPDRTVLEEHIQELEHQKRRMAEELNRVKVELANSLETNETLQNELEKTTKKLNNEQKLNEQLQNERRREDENEVELGNTKKQVGRLEKLVSTMEGQIAEMNEELQEMQKENQRLEEKNAKIVKQNEEALEEIITLQTEIEVWKRDLETAKDINKELKEENRHLQDVIEQCGCEIDKLKFERNTMEKFLKTITKKNPSESSPTTSKFSRSNSFSEYSPIVKQLLKKHTFNTPTTALKIRNPVSPLPPSPITFNSQVATTSTPEDNVKTILDTTNPSFISTGILTPNKLNDNEILSPPTMYVIDRTEEISNDLQDGSKESDSGDDLPIKLHFMAANNDTHESLQEEISKATSEECFSLSSEECHHKEKYLENEKRILSVQSELIGQIEKQSFKLEEFSKLNNDYQLKISQLNNEILDMKTQLSLSGDKESMLLERNRSLEEIVQCKKSYINEICAKLEDYQKIEAKCKELEAKIQSLENENSLKYVKIVELTIEMDRFRSGEVKPEKEEKSLEEILRNVRREREEVEVEKNRLQERLKLMEEERDGLKIEIQTLLAKIMNLEEDNKDLKRERSSLESAIKSLKSQNETLLSENSNLSECKENLTKIQSEKEMIEIEKDNLKNEIENLKKEVEKLQNELLSPKSSNSSLEKEQRDLIALNFKLKLETLEREKRLIYEDRKRLADEIHFVNQERDNMIQEIRRLRKQLHYKDEEFSIQLDKSKKDLDNSDAEKHDMENEITTLKKDLQEFTTLKFQHEELNHRYSILKDEMKTLNAKLEENLSEITSLRKLQGEYENLQEEFKKNLEEINNLKVEKNGFISKISKMNNQIEEYKIKLEKFKNKGEAQSEKLQKAIVDKTDEVKKLKSDLSEVSFKLEKVTSESTMYKNDKYSLQREHEKLKEKLKEFDDLQVKYQEVSRILDKNKKDYDILRVTHEICEQNRKELTQKSAKDLENYRLELSKIEEENGRLQDENFALKSNINTLDGEIFQLKQEISYYHTEKNKFEERRFNLVRENQDLSSKLKKNEINSKKQDIEMKQLSVENFDLRMKIEKSESTIASYFDINEQLKMTNEELSGLLQRKDEFVSELKSELESLKKTNDALHLEINHLLKTTEEFEKIKFSLKEKEEFIASIEKETLLLKQTKENLNEEMSLFKNKCEDYKAKLEEVESRLKTYEDLVEEKDDLLQSKEAKISELQKEINFKLDELKEINEKFEETKKIHEENKKIHAGEIDRKNKLAIELEESRNQNLNSVEMIEILEGNIKSLKGELQQKSSRIQNLEQSEKALIFEVETLKNLLDYPGNLLDKLKDLTEENAILRDECKKVCMEDKTKMIEETNKSFCDALQKIYTAEKKLSETEEDFNEYCQREIEKYKMENEKFKSEIANLLEEKKSIVNRLKSVESENETTRNELEGLLTEKESWIFHKSQIKSNPKEPRQRDSEKCKSDSKLVHKFTSFDKLNIRKEKLERKVQDLEGQLLAERETLADAINKKDIIENELKTLKSENVKLQNELKEVGKRIEILGSERVKGMKTKMFSEEEVRDLMRNFEDQKETLKGLMVKLEAEEHSKTAAFNQLHQLRESLSQKRFRLERCTVNIATSFKVPEGFLRKILASHNGNPQIPENLLFVDKEIGRTVEQMDITSNVLDYMALKKSNAIFQSVESQTEIIDTNKSEQRRQRSSTFTLRPATLIAKHHLGVNHDRSNDISRLENLTFASSGDAGKSRDLGIFLPRPIETIEENNVDKEEDLQDQEVSPMLSNDTLEEIGLLQIDYSLMTEEELKEKFERISVALTSGSRSIKERFTNQLMRLKMKEQQLAEELTACKRFLEDFLEGDQLKTMLSRLEIIFRQCAQVSVSAVLFGSLKHERLMSNCSMLMIHRAASLKKRLEDVEDNLRFIGQHVKMNRQLQLTDFERVLTTENLHRSLPIKTHISPRPSSRFKQVLSRCLIFWMIFIAICCLFLLSILDWDGNSVYFTLPWTWKSFDDPWAPFIKKKYLDGPPPT